MGQIAKYTYIDLNPQIQNWRVVVDLMLQAKQKNGFLVPHFLCSRRIQSVCPITNRKPGGPVSRKYEATRQLGN